MRIIGLTGYAGVGKDTVGGILVERGWHRIAFADNIKALALAADPYIPMRAARPGAMFGQPLSEIVTEDGWEEAKEYPEVRRFLQALGTGVRDVLGDRTWIDAALDYIDSEAYVTQSTDVVVTDVRTPNEADAVRDRGGKIVRVRRPGCGPVNGHVTETGIDDIRPDYTCDNDGTVAELRETVAGVLAALG